MATPLQFLIKSRDRTSGTSSSFTVTLPVAISGAFRAEYLMIPNSIYTIVTGVNDTLITSLGTITLSPGFYSTTSIQVELDAKLKVANAGYAATYNTTTKKMTITNASAFTITIVGDATTCGRVLGYTANVASTTSATGDSLVDLYPIVLLVIKITEAYIQPLFRTDNLVKGAWIVPLTATQGNLMHLFSSELGSTVFNFTGTTTLTILIYDEQGQAISLNGLDWMFKLTRIE